MATPREQLADALRQARVDAGYTSHATLAKRLNVSRPVITRAENTSQPVPSNAIIAAWADATGADQAMLNDYAQRARSPRNWFAHWADDFETRATTIRWFEPLLVPGLLQTESYARAVVSWKPFSADIASNLSERLARQSVVDRAELRVLLLGSVLHREVGDAPVMSEQNRTPAEHRQPTVCHATDRARCACRRGGTGRGVRNQHRRSERRSGLRGLAHSWWRVHRYRPGSARCTRVRWFASGRATVVPDAGSSRAGR
jgi:transcriptional regulator with XRE-family HTH domain